MIKGFGHSGKHKGFKTLEKSYDLRDYRKSSIDSARYLVERIKWLHESHHWYILVLRGIFEAHTGSVSSGCLSDVPKPRDTYSTTSVLKVASNTKWCVSDASRPISCVFWGNLLLGGSLWVTVPPKPPSPKWCTHYLGSQVSGTDYLPR